MWEFNTIIAGKRGGNNSNKISEEIIARVGSLFEYKCMSKKQLKQVLIERNL